MPPGGPPRSPLAAPRRSIGRSAMWWTRRQQPRRCPRRPRVRTQRSQASPPRRPRPHGCRTPVRPSLPRSPRRPPTRRRRRCARRGGGGPTCSSECFRWIVLACPRCGGRMRVLATIDEPRVVRRILSTSAPWATRGRHRHQRRGGQRDRHRVGESRRRDPPQRSRRVPAQSPPEHVADRRASARRADPRSLGRPACACHRRRRAFDAPIPS